MEQFRYNPDYEQSNIEDKIEKFRFLLLRKMPFYGDVLLHLPFIESNDVKKACTDGRRIYINQEYFTKLRQGEGHYILMHEVFHILLMHCIRNKGRYERLWNIACDLVVNDMLDKLRPDMKKMGIAFEPPMGNLTANIGDSPVEDVYNKLRNDNKMPDRRNVVIRKYYGLNQSPTYIKEIPDERDLKPETCQESGKTEAVKEQKARALENEIRNRVSEALKRTQGQNGSYYIPNCLICLVESKKLMWSQILKDYLGSEVSEEISYLTPERKYLHMDLIVPGAGIRDDKLEEIWAFVDNSGSILLNQRNQFLTQVYRIAMEFHCKVNICYWDMKVTDVYRNVVGEKNVLKCIPHHSGGTDINCVYAFLQERNIRPDVMLILTDGYYGQLKEKYRSNRLRRKTVLVLSGEIPIDDRMKEIGQVARLVLSSFL